MTLKKKAKKSPTKPNVTLRYFDEEHCRLVRDAATHAKAVSINSWIISVTLAAARKELGV